MTALVRGNGEGFFKRAEEGSCMLEGVTENKTKVKRVPTALIVFSEMLNSAQPACVAATSIFPTTDVAKFIVPN